MSLPTDAKARKALPIFSGVLKYFPNAVAEVAGVSVAGNEQHHPGQPLHWDMSKSTDEGDALLRHQMEAGTRDTDGQRHSAKVAWRALAQLEREILAEQAAEKQRQDLAKAQMNAQTNVGMGRSMGAFPGGLFGGGLGGIGGLL